MTRPVYFDCDPGIDDSLALAYLLASPEVEIVGVGSVHGNMDATTTADNALRLLALAGRQDIPVAVGANDPIAGVYGGGAAFVHGANALGNIETPDPDTEPVSASAADLLLELSHTYDHELEIVAVGPLTNLGLALEKDPGLPERIASVTIMGGAAMVPGNVSPVTEANIGNDPEAAQLVLSARWPVTIAPLDTTMVSKMSEKHRRQLEESEWPLAQAIGKMFDFYFDFYVSEFGERCSCLHDPLASAIAVGEYKAQDAPLVPVEVDTTQGPGRGQMIVDLRSQRLGYHDVVGGNARVVLGVDGRLADHLLARVASMNEDGTRPL